MPVPSSMADLSATASSNSPSGSDSITTSTFADDYIRALSAIVRFEESKGADIASASTVDLSTATGKWVDVTGTTTITSLGTLGAGIERVVRFTGALTLTHNATSLILPRAANITTANGDAAVFRSLGSGNWVCIHYQRATAANARSDLGLGTAATLNVGTSANNIVQLDGSAKLPAVDGSQLTGLTASQISGSINIVKQVVYAELTSSGTTTATIPVDDTIPQITEGAEILTCAITPTSASSNLIIQVFTNLCEDSNTTDSLVAAALFRDSTADAVGACLGMSNASGGVFGSLANGQMNFVAKVSAGSTSSTTFRLRVGGETSATWRWNGGLGSRRLGGSYKTTITIFEV